MLVLWRTAPGQSYVNPVVRVMSVLNLAIHGLALAREECEADTEAALKTANGIKAVRQALTKADAALEGGAETHTERYDASMRKHMEQIEKAVEVKARTPLVHCFHC